MNRSTRAHPLRALRNVLQSADDWIIPAGRAFS